jgi:hypothetical protein
MEQRSESRAVEEVKMSMRAAAAKYIVRFTLLVCTTGALVSCDSTSASGTYTNYGVFVPTAASDAQFSVSLLSPVIAITGPCSAGTLTTSVELVVVASSGPVSVDSVMLHMIDGTNLGGPAVTFPSSQLGRMFGTTTVVHTRAFVFSPSFVCPDSRPQSLTAEIIVIDGSGKAKKLAANAAFPE